MASAKDVMAILKATSVKLDNDTLMILSFMYHTEATAGENGRMKTDRSKSQYRYEGRIVKIADLQNEITEMEAKPTEAWKWPNLIDWRCSYDEDATNARGAKWLKARIKKAVDWPTGEKILNGWKASKNDYSDSRKYDLAEYVSDVNPNEKFNITLESMQALGAGHTFGKILTPKRAAS